MTDRERWTVYPLLFLTLGIAVKDKVVGRLTADTMLCNTLVVHDNKGREQVVISSSPVGGQVVSLGGKNGLGVLVGHTDTLAGLMFVDGRGRLIRSLATMPVSAVVPADANRPAPESNESARPPADEQPAPPDERSSQEKPSEQPGEPTPEQ